MIIEQRWCHNIRPETLKPWKPLMRRYKINASIQNLCQTILTGILNQLDKEQGISKNDTLYTTKQVNPKNFPPKTQYYKPKNTMLLIPAIMFDPIQKIETGMKVMTWSPWSFPRTDKSTISL